MCSWQVHTHMHPIHIYVRTWLVTCVTIQTEKTALVQTQTAPMASSCSPRWLRERQAVETRVTVTDVVCSSGQSVWQLHWIIVSSVARAWTQDTFGSTAPLQLPAQNPPLTGVHTRAHTQDRSGNWPSTPSLASGWSLDRVVSPLPHTSSLTRASRSPWKLASEIYCSGPSVPTALHQRITYFHYSSGASHLQILLLYIFISSISVTSSFTKSRINMTHI